LPRLREQLCEGRRANPPFVAQKPRSPSFLVIMHLPSIYAGEAAGILRMPVLPESEVSPSTPLHPARDNSVTSGAATAACPAPSGDDSGQPTRAETTVAKKSKQWGSTWGEIHFAHAMLERVRRGLEQTKRASDEARERLELERMRIVFERERLEAAQSTGYTRLPNDRLWSEDEAARYLGKSTRWLRDSTVPKLRLPGKGERPSIMYEPHEVRAWASAHRTHSVVQETVATMKPSTRRKKNGVPQR